MKKTKLFIMLGLLEAEEVSPFNVFLRKQLRKNSHLGKFWRLLHKSYLKEGNWEELHKESNELYKKLYPRDTKKDTAKFNNIRSRLIQLLRDFLIQKWLEAHPIEQERAFLEVLRERGAVDEYLRLGEQLRERIKTEEEQNVLQRFWAFYIEHGLYFQRTGLGIYTDDNFADLQKELQRLLFKLQASYALEDSFRQEMMGRSKRQISLSEVLKRHPELQRFNKEAWEVYQAVVAFEAKPVLSNWERCLALFLNHRQQLDKGEQSLLLTWLINVGYSLQIKDDESVRPHLLNLYRLALEENILLNENRHLHPQHLLNAAVLARAAENRQFLEELRDDYLELLQEEEAENMDALINAFIAFVDTAHEEALRYLQYVRFSSISYSLLSYELEVKCQLELLLLDKDDQLEESLQRFSTYLSRKIEELPREIHIANRNFIRACRNIQRHYAKGHLQEEEASYEVSLNETYLVARDWLQEKWEML